MLDGIADFIGGVVGFVGDAIFGILGAIAQAFASVADAIISFLPDAASLGLPDLSGIVRGYAWLDSWLPITPAIAAFGIYIAVSNAGFLFNLATRIYHLIPKPGMGT